jgi:hypothetical protein
MTSRSIGITIALLAGATAVAYVITPNEMAHNPLTGPIIILFAVASGILYRWVQDRGRTDEQGRTGVGWMRYALHCLAGLVLIFAAFIWVVLSLWLSLNVYLIFLPAIALIGAGGCFIGRTVQLIIIDLFNKPTRK